MAQIAFLRGWQYFAGLQLLADRGLLWYAEVFDAGRKWPAWVITDSTRVNAQARRLDGKVWEGIGGAKAKTLPGSVPSWPIGAAEIGNHRSVVLCEGQPDFAAALLVAWWEDTDVAPVCMTGAGNSILPDALSRFTGKHVRIAVHDDDAGRAAGTKWAIQLDSAGVESLDWYDFGGMTRRDNLPVKDLSDYATLLDLDRSTKANVFDGMPSVEVSTKVHR